MVTTADQPRAGDGLPRAEISVVIPVHNRAQAVLNALRSVANQTCPPQEILVVDDASTDGTAQVIEREFSALPGLDILAHSSRKGGAAARNTAIKRARGEVIAFLDSDDSWMPERLEHQAGCFEDGDVILAFVDCWRLRQRWRPVWHGNRRIGRGSEWREFLSSHRIGSCSGVMVRRNVLGHVGGFDEELPSCHDWDLWVRLHGEGDFIESDRPLFRYHTKTSDRISRNYVAVSTGTEAMFERIRRLPQYREHADYIEANFHLTRAEYLARVDDPSFRIASELWQSLRRRPTPRLVRASYNVARSLSAKARPLRRWKDRSLAG